MKNRVVLFLLLVVGCASDPKSSSVIPAIDNPWSEVGLPALSSSENRSTEAIGFYSAGCIKSAVSIYPDGVGYRVMRTSRKRYYGHPQLVSFLERIGRQIHQLKLGVILIGDMAQARGGPSLTGHLSHQTGLDVDIWYSQAPSSENLGVKLTLSDRETLSASSVLTADKQSLNSQTWTGREKKIILKVAQDEAVDRIFVTPWVKKDLCLHSKDRAGLNKLRPWWAHDDHFHVRLKCPHGSPLCKTQESIPMGEGCDSTLDWWFSDEARLKAMEKKEPAPFPPRLPLECAAVLAEPS